MKQNTHLTEAEMICDSCSTIPLSYLDLDLGTPISGWKSSLANRGVEIVRDSLGREAIPRAAFAEMIVERNEAERRHIEESRRRAEEAPKRPAVVGVPAQEGMTAHESMLAATGLITPDQEFGRREPPRFLEEALDESARALAEKRAQTARKKDRLTGQMKSDLG